MGTASIRERAREAVYATAAASRSVVQLFLQRAEDARGCAVAIDLVAGEERPEILNAQP